MKIRLLLAAVLLTGCIAQVTPQATPNAVETVRASSRPTEAAQPADTARPTATQTSQSTESPQLATTGTPTLTPSVTDLPVRTVSPTWTVTPTQTPRPTLAPTLAFSPTAKALPTAMFTQPATAGITLVRLTSPVARGTNATLAVRVAPGATCTPGVIYKSGPSKARGLDAKTARADGSLSWTWTVGDKTTPGTWKVTVDCAPGVHAEWPFVVQ